MTGASQCYFFRTDITVRGLLCSFSIPGSLTWMAKTPCSPVTPSCVCYVLLFWYWDNSIFSGCLLWSLKQVLLSNSDEVRDSTLDTYPSRYGFQNYCLVGAAVGTARSMLEYVFPETFWLVRPPASGNLCAQHAFGAPLRFSVHVSHSREKQQPRNRR